MFCPFYFSYIRFLLSFRCEKKVAKKHTSPISDHSLCGIFPHNVPPYPNLTEYIFLNKPNYLNVLY